MIEQQFRDKLLARSKTQMLAKFFRNQDWLDIPIFSEFTGKKQITPFRNTHCIQPTCVYDLEELVDKFRSSAYSNYLNFICHTCRKLLDIQYFFYDEELDKMVRKIWKKYNNHDKIICSQVSIFKNGEWEPVLPEYIKSLERNMRVQQQEKKLYPEQSSVNKITIEPDNQLEEVSFCENLPMFDEFMHEEYKGLIAEFSNDENPHYEQDVILRRFNATILWGEFLHLKENTSFSLSIMALFMRYMDEYFRRKKLKLGVINKKQTAFITIKVTGFDQFKQIPKFYYISDTFENLAKGPLMNSCDMAVIVIHYDERYMLYIVSLGEQKFKQIDFLEEGISRTSQTELHSIGAYLIEQIFPPIKIPRIGSRETEQQIMGKQIVAQQISEIGKKVQYYNDCGHHIAFYLYSYIAQELDQMKKQKQWQDQGFAISTRLAPIVFQKEEKSSFTIKVQWLIIRLINEPTQKIKFFNFKEADSHIKESSFVKQDETVNDSIDQLLKENSLAKQWLGGFDESRIEKQQNQTKGLLFSQTVGKILLNIQPESKQKNQENEQKRAEKYWQTPAAQPKEINLPNNVSPVQSAIQLQSKNNQSSQSMQSLHHQTPQQKRGPQELQISSNMHSQDSIQKKPFMVIPKQELAYYLDYYKDKITEEYRKQAIYRQYFQMSEQAQYQQLQQQSQLQMQRQSQNGDISMSKSEFERFQKRFYSQVSPGNQIDENDQRELLELQRELGLDEDQLANLDVNEYNQLLDVMDALGKERKQNQKLKKKQKKIEDDDDEDESRAKAGSDEEKSQENSKIDNSKVSQQSKNSKQSKKNASQQ